MDTIKFTAKEREFVYGVAMKYMKDEEKAHDVTQDALLLAYRHRDSFRGDSRFTTWLYRIAATTALMHLRKDRRVPLMQSIDGAPANDDGRRWRTSRATRPRRPRTTGRRRRRWQIAGERLAELGDKYGKIFSMRFVEGYSESEIARKLSLNVATVKTRAYRARAHLRASSSERAAPP